jgi:hypothetical protein
MIKQHGQSLWVEAIPNDGKGLAPAGEIYQTAQEALARLSAITYRRPNNKDEILYQGAREDAPPDWTCDVPKHPAGSNH